MRAIVYLVVFACLASADAGAAPTGCENFRCAYGDVPTRREPLIAEPFRAFYTDAVVMPLIPYRPDAASAPATSKAEHDDAAPTDDDPAKPDR
ncbi:hypothetical protein [Salinicola aestuarinus]|uniref:hypothetical protein n=1 Tax=Salinicola aestuarinus TaxID=1949082 RepID=UPI000DA1E034|nr:hypothetical protein [Salinicola aestuarinus]